MGYVRGKRGERKGREEGKECEKKSLFRHFSGAFKLQGGGEKSPQI